MLKIQVFCGLENDISKNQPIFFPQEPSKSIYFLKKGRVKLSRMSPDGKEMILGLVHMGEVFGEAELFCNN